MRARVRCRVLRGGVVRDRFDSPDRLRASSTDLTICVQSAVTTPVILKAWSLRLLQDGA